MRFSTYVTNESVYDTLFPDVTYNNSPTIGGTMQLNLTGHHVEVTQALRSYVEKKLERIVRHSDHVLDVHCILTVDRKSTRLNSSHPSCSYAVCCLKKKTNGLGPPR